MSLLVYDPSLNRKIYKVETIVVATADDVKVVTPTSTHQRDTTQNIDLRLYVTSKDDKPGICIEPDKHIAIVRNSSLDYASTYSYSCCPDAMYMFMVELSNLMGDDFTVDIVKYVHDQLSNNGSVTFAELSDIGVTLFGTIKTSSHELCSYCSNPEKALNDVKVFEHNHTNLLTIRDYCSNIECYP